MCDYYRQKFRCCSCRTILLLTLVFALFSLWNLSPSSLIYVDMDHSNHMDHNHNHGEMDHGNMDHHGQSGTMDHGDMKMYFHASNEAVILFSGWKTSTAWQMFGSCLVMIILAALYEGLKVFREYLLQRSSTVQSNGAVLAVPVPTSEIPVDKTHVVRKPAFSCLYHVVQSLLHMIQVTVSYVLMLVVMTYNVWLCLSIVVGAGIGYFVFGRLRRVNIDINEHCH